MAEEEKQDAPKAPIPRHRSPNYPYMGLEDAIDRLRQLNEVGRGHYVLISTARDHWDYQRNAGDRTAAALRSYGLVEVKGEGEKREYKPTEAGIKILEGHSQREQLIKEAALKPEIYKQVWDYYGGNLPADPVIREYLRWEKKFNPDNIDKFLKQFRDTITFANLTESDKIEPDVELDEALNDLGTSEEEQNKPLKPMDSAEEIRQRLTLPQGMIFRAGIEVFADGMLNVQFAGSMNGLTMPLLNEIYQLKEKYESEEVQKKAFHAWMSPKQETEKQEEKPSRGRALTLAPDEEEA